MSEKGMRVKDIVLILLVLASYSVQSASISGAPKLKRPYYTMDSSPLTKKQKKFILGGEVYSKSNAESFTRKILHKNPPRIEEADMQRFYFFIAGLHKKSCRIALKKLKYYENYKQYLGFVKSSSYTQENSRVHLRLSHSILPIDMILYFILPRISKPGVYPFEFDVGFLKGLKGQIHVSNYKKRCFFYTTAHWEGPHTGFSDILFEFFSKSLGTMALENLFRISGGI